MLFWPHTPFCTLVLQRSFYVIDGGLRSTTYNQGSSVCMNGRYFVAWENRKHLATPPVVSSRNDAWKASTEIPYPWHATAHIWVVLLIGRSNFPTNQIWVLASHQYGISLLVSQTSLLSSQGNQWWRNVGCFLRLGKLINEVFFLFSINLPCFLSFFLCFVLVTLHTIWKKKLHCIWEIKGFFEIKRTREKTLRTKNEKWENINSITLFKCPSQFHFSRWS